MKKQGHFCKVCQQYKANEKFGGKGHAAHICKACAVANRAHARAVNKAKREALAAVAKKESADLITDTPQILDKA